VRETEIYSINPHIFNFFGKRAFDLANSALFPGSGEYIYYLVTKKLKFARLQLAP
jgi:hypothetical protein